MEYLEAEKDGRPKGEDSVLREIRKEKKENERESSKVITNVEKSEQGNDR